MYTIRNKPQYTIRTQNRYVSQDETGVKMPVPLGGIDKSQSPRDIADINVSSADNVWISEDGFVEMLPGYEAWGDINSSRVLGVYEFIASPTSKFRIFAYGDDGNSKGVLGYFDTAGTFTALVGKVHTSGTATAGGATTLTNSGATWVVNFYKGYTLKITGGTGSGQSNEIVSNTATEITVKSAWSTNPDNTSTYEIITALDKDTTVGFATYINDKGAEILGDTTATSGSGTGITKTSAGWTVGAYNGKLIKLVSGTGAGQYRQILSNTADTITIKGSNWDTNPDATTHFKVLELGNSLYFKQTDSKLYEFDGSNITVHTDKPEGNALYIWQERLLIGGADDMVFQASVPFKPTDFTGKGSFFGNVGSENGQKITGFLELPQGRLAVFKEKSHQVINGLGGTSDIPIVSAESVSQMIGASGVRAFCEIQTDAGNGAILFSKDRKIYPFGYLKDILSSIVGSGEELSSKIEELINVDEDELSNVKVSYDKKHDKVWISYIVEDVTNVVIYDLARKQFNPFWYSSDINIGEVIIWDNELYFTSATTGRLFKMTETEYKRLDENYTASVTYKEFTGKNLNPKSFTRIILALKNTNGSLISKARITDVDEIHQLATDIPMGGDVGMSGGSGGGVSGLIPSGGYDTVYDVSPSSFVKRQMELDDYIGHSLELQCSSTDFMSISTFTIEAELYSEDEEDINIQF